MTGGPLLAVYQCLWKAAMPLVSWYVRQKDLQRLVPSAITAERFGRSGPSVYWRKGQKVASTKDEFSIIWIHGASTGECLSGLPLVEVAQSQEMGRSLAMSADRKMRKVRVLVSTTTPTARQVITERLKENDNAVCILAPLDHQQCVQQFYNTWQPDVGIWIESELWPTLITEGARRGIRIGLINGRMSAQSLRLWRLPGLHTLARSVVGLFSLVLCQDEENRHRFNSLGARNADVALNLKFASKRSVSNQSEFSALRRAIGARSAWVAASTHDNEEVMMAGVHVELTKRLQSDGRLLTIIIPRHPDRAYFIVEQIHRQFPEVVIGMRSRDGLPTNSVDVFIVDTMDETGLMYDCVSTAVIGGSFVQRGGHNPIEPLRAGCFVLMGPHMENFSDIISQIHHQSALSEALRSVMSLEELVVALENRLVTLRKRSSTLPARVQLMRAMDDLALTTLSLHKLRLINWIAKNGSINK